MAVNPILTGANTLVIPIANNTFVAICCALSVFAHSGKYLWIVDSSFAAGTSTTSTGSIPIAIRTLLSPFVKSAVVKFNLLMVNKQPQKVEKDNVEYTAIDNIPYSLVF